MVKVLWGYYKPTQYLHRDKVSMNGNCNIVILTLDYTYRTLCFRMQHCCPVIGIPNTYLPPIHHLSEIDREHQRKLS